MKNAQLSFLIKSKRSIIYVLFLLLILLGHHYFMQIPMDLFRYIRQSTMSMICVICFYGAFMLLLQKKMGTGRYAIYISDDNGRAY